MLADTMYQQAETNSIHDVIDETDDAVSDNDNNNKQIPFLINHFNSKLKIRIFVMRVMFLVCYIVYYS